MSPIQLGLQVAARRCAVMAVFALPLIGAATLSSTSASACPFCGTVTQTLGEEMGGAAAVVLARIVLDEEDTEADAATDATGASIPAVQPKTRFRVESVLKGEDRLAGAEEIEVLFFGQPKPEATYLVMAIDGPSLEWSTPIVLSNDAVPYVSQLLDLPEKGGDRLAFFQEFFEHADPMLAQDSYDEFAKAPYAEVKELRERMYHDKLVGWIENTEVISSRRRLYLTLLGICGDEDDVPMLAEMIQSDNRETKTALDALIACYLTLGGNDGMPLVEELFLANADAEYTDTYAAIMALRFHGQEEDTIQRERLLSAMRLMLDRPTLADLVIPDLARWEDWSVAGRLVTLYKEADTESSWVRVPVIHYLRALDNKVDAYLQETAEVDPDAYKRANTFFPIQAAKPVPPATDATTADATTAADIAPGDAAAAATATAGDSPTTDTTDADADTTTDAAAATDDDADAPVTTSEAEPSTGASSETDGLAAADTATSESNEPAEPAPAEEPAVPPADGAAAQDAGMTADEPTTSKTTDDAATDDAATDDAATDDAATDDAATEDAATEDAATGEFAAEGQRAAAEPQSEGHAASGRLAGAGLLLLMLVAGVMLFGVFALLLLGGRQPNRPG